MSLRVSFELDEGDLEHFRLIMHQARSSSAQKKPEDIVASAERLMMHNDVKNMPGFITQRFGKLQTMLHMITDVDWRLPHEETRRILNALAYFTEPDDLIPDGIPGLGFLDDAIMIELVVRELSFEIETYKAFCDYRDRSPAKSRKQLEARRGELLTELSKRRQDRLNNAQQSAPGLLD